MGRNIRRRKPLRVPKIVDPVVKKRGPVMVPARSMSVSQPSRYSLP
ncbi:MAG: hypothetical protein IPF47_19840 [Gemmatimonadetes bacterium]|nr:hypothetical protein [Gemmatimonadota bacterium]